MEHIILFIFLFLSIVLLFQAVLQGIYKRKLVVDQRIEDYIGPTTPIKEKKDIKKEMQIPESLENARKKVKQELDKKITLETKSELEKKLRDAGISYNWSAVDFRFLQLAIAGILFFVSFLLFGKMSDEKGTLLFLSLSLGALGYYYPIFYLGTKKKKRMAQIEKSLADFFDMVNLSIEAGMGLDAAISRVCKTKKGPLSEEFERALEEMRLGKSRREAFINLRNRVPMDTFHSIMTSMIQADQLGIGMSKVLRTLTERIREHQRQLAREKAMKAPVKMMFPMIFFIFPSLFIVLLGPLIIYLMVFGLGG